MYWFAYMLVLAIFLPTLALIIESLIRAEVALWRRWRYGVPFLDTWRDH